MATYVAKRQRFRRLRFGLAEFLDANGNVMKDLCVMSVTHVARTARGTEMNYLANVVNRRPMLGVVGEILLAFCFATPLVLLLCFLV
jgi:hypothetical protein